MALSWEIPQAEKASNTPKIRVKPLRTSMIFSPSSLANMVMIALYHRYIHSLDFRVYP